MKTLLLNQAATALMWECAQAKVFSKSRRDGVQLGIRPSRFVHQQWKDSLVGIKMVDGLAQIEVSDDVLAKLGVTLGEGMSYQLIDISSHNFRLAPSPYTAESAPEGMAIAVQWAEPGESKGETVQDAVAETAKPAVEQDDDVLVENVA